MDFEYDEDGFLPGESECYDDCPQLRRELDDEHSYITQVRGALLSILRMRNQPLETMLGPIVGGAIIAFFEGMLSYDGRDKPSAYDSAIGIAGDIISNTLMGSDPTNAAIEALLSVGVEEAAAALKQLSRETLIHLRQEITGSGDPKLEELRQLVDRTMTQRKEGAELPTHARK